MKHADYIDHIIKDAEEDAVRKTANDGASDVAIGRGEGERSSGNLLQHRFNTSDEIFTKTISFAFVVVMSFVNIIRRIRPND